VGENERLRESTSFLSPEMEVGMFPIKYTEPLGMDVMPGAMV
jgi:hypothetical protein